MPSADKNKVSWDSNKQKNPKEKNTANDVKRSGKVKKHKADTTANEVKQNTGKKKKCKATTAAYDDNPVLSEQADGSISVSVDGSDSSDDSGSLSCHSGSDNVSGDESDKTSHSDDQDQRCIKELRDFLLDKFFEKADAVQFKTLWEKHPQDVGLLVCERVVNLPFELIPPLYDGLFDEVSWAVEDEPTQELRDSFQFKHYLLLTRVYQTIPKECTVEKTEKKKRKKGSLQNGDDQNDGKDQLIYIKPEDEIFQQLSSWSFTFPVHADYLATHELKDVKPMRLLMAIKVEKIQTFRSQLKALINES